VRSGMGDPVRGGAGSGRLGAVAEPTHELADLDRVIAAARDSGEQWTEFMRAGMFSAGVYRLAAGETDRQTPHAEDEIYYVLEGASRRGRVGRVRRETSRSPLREHRRGPRGARAVRSPRVGLEPQRTADQVVDGARIDPVLFLVRGGGVLVYEGDRELLARRAELARGAVERG
jgi:hypothetical protein